MRDPLTQREAAETSWACRYELSSDAGCNVDMYDSLDRLLSDAETSSSANGCGNPTTQTIDYSYDGLDRQTQRSVDDGSGNGTGKTTNSYYDGLTTTLTGQTNLTTSTSTSPNWSTLFELGATGQHSAVNQTGGPDTGVDYLDTPTATTTSRP